MKELKSSTKSPPLDVQTYLHGAGSRPPLAPLGAHLSADHRVARADPANPSRHPGEGGWVHVSQGLISRVPWMVKMGQIGLTRVTMGQLGITWVQMRLKCSKLVKWVKIGKKG